MATVKVFIDTRVTGSDAPSPVKIAICHKGKTAYVGTSIRILPTEYNEKKQQIVGGANSAFKTNMLKAALLKCQQAVLELTNDGRIIHMSASDIKNFIESGGERSGGLFIPYYIKESNKKAAKRTREIYEATRVQIERFDRTANLLTFDDITPSWLKNFDNWLTHHANTANSRSIHMRNIRAVLNAAIDDELTTNYPFRKFKIKTEATRKRNLTVVQLREYYNAHLSQYERYFRDIFFLSFFLIGINSVDLFRAREPEADGRLVYRRAKTHRLYDIKIEPEAAEIIERHAGKSGLLVDLAEKYRDEASFRSQADKVLKRFFDGLSMYWARHSWATLAAELEIPIETIAAALGHNYGSRVTNVYINFNQKKIDEANRRVIDYLLKQD